MPDFINNNAKTLTIVGKQQQQQHTAVFPVVQIRELYLAKNHTLHKNYYISNWLNLLLKISTKEF